MIDFLIQIGDFLRPIFYTIVSMSVIGTIMGIVIFVIQKIFDKLITPKWKCIIWIVFVISLLLPIRLNIDLDNSISNLLEPIENISYKEEYEARMASYNSYVQRGEPNKEEYENVTNELNLSTFKFIAFDYAIPGIWFGIFIIILIFFYIGGIIVSLRLGKNYVTDERILKILQECKDSLNIKKNIKIVKQNYCKTASIFNLKIAITDEIMKQEDYKIKNMFMHELAHYKRRDVIFNYVLIFAQAVHWFNPFTWILIGRVRQDMEVAVDELAINKMNDEECKEYGRTLIESLNKPENKKISNKMLCLARKHRSTKRRIEMIKLKEKFNKNNKTVAIISIILIIILVLLFFTISSKDTSNKMYTFDFKNVAPYAIPYVGDSASVRNIVSKLSLSNVIKDIQFNTREKPYTIAVIYGEGSVNRNGMYTTYSTKNLNEYKDFIENKTEQEKQEILENNARALFALIDNLDEIKFRLAKIDELDEILVEYSFSRNELEEKYNMDLREYLKNPEKF